MVIGYLLGCGSMWIYWHLKTKHLRPKLLLLERIADKLDQEVGKVQELVNETPLTGGI